jgi:quinol monooxygenase YgiN
VTYGLFGTLTAATGRRDALVGHLLQAAELLEQNGSCLQYIVGTSTEPDTVAVFEIWTDQVAHDASLQDEDIRALIQQARPLIAGMSEQNQLTVRGGKGIPA